VAPFGRAKGGAPLLCGLAAAALGLGLTGSDGASAYVGYSFASIPGIVGGAPQPEFRDWLMIEGHYWGGSRPARFEEGLAIGGNIAVLTAQIAQEQGAAQQAPASAQGRPAGAPAGTGQARRNAALYSGTDAPADGAGELTVAISKKSPALAGLMARCKSRTAIPELKFAESAELARFSGVMAPLPPEVPAYYTYNLKNVDIRACGVDPLAPTQALILKFDDIEWLKGKPGTVPLTLPTPQLAPLDPGGHAMTFVIHWLAIAGDVSDDQCTRINEKPGEEEFYRLYDPAEAAKEKPVNDAQGGVNFENGQFEWRGPDKTSAAKLPMAVRDPGHFMVTKNVARGVDLDGHDGKGAPPAGICRHENFVSDDGRRGVDNQLFRVQGCIRAYQGHKGFYQQYKMEQKRNGRTALLLQISGIDDARNDDRIQVTLVHSRDPMTKSADGSKILAHYTYRVADDPMLNYFATRLSGRIQNGVIVTDPVKELHIQDSSSVLFHQGRLRLQVTPDGNLKGIVAGYQDWRRVFQLAQGSNQEQLYGLHIPGHYYALARAADGLKDPVTGQCWGISSVFDIEGSRAFVSSAPARFAVAKETRFGLAPYVGPLASARQASR
jgi:hypothetical protein